MDGSLTGRANNNNNSMLQRQSVGPTALQYSWPYRMETLTSPNAAAPAEQERLAYSVHEAADLLGVDYLSVDRLIQRGKLRACRALRGKLLVPRTELLRLLKS